MKPNNKGAILSIEGIDGAGKSTTARRVVDILTSEGEEPLHLDKWYAVPFSQDVDVATHMKALNNVIFGRPRTVASTMGDKHWLHMLAAWHSAINDLVIEPAVDAGRYVILENSPQKTMARYLAKEAADKHFIEECFAGLIKPHCTVLLDIDPVVSLSRKGEFSSVEAGSDNSPAGYISFQNKVRRELQQRAWSRGWSIVDAKKLKAEEVAILVVNEFKTYLEEK